jgi:hypothetical protein
MLNTSVLLGLDLAAQSDYTVLSMLELEQQNLKNPTIMYKLIYLKKFPLKTSYPSIVNWLVWFINKTFLNNEYRMIVDYTGVGRPVVDLLLENDINLIALTITSGHGAHWKFGREVTVPKKELVSSVQVVLQNYRLKVASDIKHLEDLKKEFLNFKARINSRANTQFSASSGYHDDIVMSIALATWYGEHATRRGRKLKIVAGN